MIFGSKKNAFFYLQAHNMVVTFAVVVVSGLGSEADSMEEYGDPDQPKMFTEDGSWIGQYASTTVRSNDAVVTTTVQQPAGSTFV